MASTRSWLTTGAAVVAAGIGGAAIANAASSPSTSTSTTPSAASQGSGQAPSGKPGGRHGGPHTVNGKAEQPLTGDTAEKVKAAALKKVPGTVERVETNVDGSAPYEAHITKSDGTSVEVQVSKDFDVVAVNTMGGHP